LGTALAGCVEARNIYACVPHRIKAAAKQNNKRILFANDSNRFQE